MKKSLIILLTVLAVIALLIGVGVSKYNTIIVKEEQVNKYMSNIDTQLQRRLDLIPNLVNTVKGYANHEEAVIEKVTSARANLMNAKTAEEKANADAELTSALNNLLVIVENYRDLKANQSFIQLQDELAGTENRISVARMDYNTSVEEYNSYIKLFPTNIIANMTGHGTKDYYKATEKANEVPQVSFE